MAFLKFICTQGKPFSPEWTTNPLARFRSATPVEKCRFCLEQAVVLSYLDYIYGKKGTTILREYRQFFESWYMRSLKEQADKNNDPYSKNIYITCSILLGTMPGKIDSEQTIKYLADETIDVPCALNKSFYEPYLKFKSNVADLRQYIENDQMNKTRSFTISHECSVPSFKIISRFIVVSYELVFPSYSFNYRNLKDIIEDMYEVDTIFTYLTGYLWNGKSSTGVFGILASQCLTYDHKDIDPNSPMLGFIDIYSNVINVNCYLPEYLEALSSAIATQRRKIVRFLIHLRKHQKIVFEDIEMLSDYAASLDSDDNRPLKEYFTSPKEEISTEVYSAFRNSRFSAFPELDKFSREYRDATGGVNGQGANGSGSDDAENTAPNSENQGTEDELSGLESPSGIQDSSRTDADPNQGTSDTVNETEQQPNNETPEDDEDLPPLPRVSDKKGVELKLSDGESPDTVFYRDELRTWINSILRNPPKKLSVQTIEGIRKVKAKWMYLLSVDCLYKVLSTLIKMPKDLKVKPPKKNEK